MSTTIRRDQMMLTSPKGESCERVKDVQSYVVARKLVVQRSGEDFAKNLEYSIWFYEGARRLELQKEGEAVCEVYDRNSFRLETKHFRVDDLVTTRREAEDLAVLSNRDGAIKLVLGPLQEQWIQHLRRQWRHYVI